MNANPPIQRKLLTHPISRPALRNPSKYALRELRGLVMHWTANESRGANALANRNYFNLGSRYASAHFIVDDHSTIQCIPENEVAYHVGAKRYLEAGQKIMAGGSLNPNYYTLGIEMCVNKDGDWDKTYQNSVSLAAFLFYKFQMPENSLYRHFDITGKDCPKMMIEPEPWERFINDVSVAVMGFHLQIIGRGSVNTSGLNVRTGPGTQYDILGQLAEGDPVLIFEEQGNWVRIEPGGWVHAAFIINRAPIVSEFRP